MRTEVLDPVEEARRRAAVSWHEGGLVEIALGVFLLVLSGLLYAETRIERGTALHQSLVMGQAVFVIGGSWLLRRAIPWLRNRWLASRGGYVRPCMNIQPDQKVKTFAIGFVAALVPSVLIGGKFLGQPGSDRLLTIFVGALCGLLLCKVGWDTGLRRFLLMGALVPVLSALIAWQALGLDLALIWSFRLLGVMFLVSGILVLARFLRTNPPVVA